MSYLIDTHCHLDFPQLYQELDLVLERAAERGVKKFITIGVRLKDTATILNMVDNYENIFCALGTHPCNAAEELDISLAELIKHGQHNKVVALGETGLDYHYQPEKAEEQRKCFLKHIEAAQDTGLPLVIHSRNADADMQQLLSKAHSERPFGFVLHCYSSGLELAKFAIALGGYISFSGLITFKNAQDIRDIAKIVPRHQILVETDAPYLAPVPHRGRSNEPAYVADTAKLLAQTLDMSYEDLMDQTTKNALTLFPKLCS